MNNSKRFEIAINITCHSEGRYLFRTLKSINQNLLLLKKYNLPIQINFCLDDADELTRSLVRNFKSEYAQIFIYESNFKDPPLARNLLIEKSDAMYIAFIDADDLWSRNWLKRCYINALILNKPAVYVYDYIYSFEGKYEISKLVDSTSPDFNIINFTQFNYYPATLFVHHQIFDEIKFEAIKDKDIYGPEDWIWNIKTLQKGYRFKVVKNTYLFYRRKYFQSESVCFQHYSSEKVLPKLPVFSIESLKSRIYTSPFIELPETTSIPQIPTEVPVSVFKNTDVYVLTSTFYRIFRNIARRWIGRIKKLVFSTKQENHVVVDPAVLVQNLIIPTVAAPIVLSRRDKALLNINSIEPQISNIKYGGVVEYRINYYNEFSYYFYKIAKRLKSNSYDTIVFIPWLIRGGADKVSISLINGLHKVDPNTRILVVMSEKAEHSWINLINNLSFVDIIDIKREIPTHIDLNMMFRTIITQWGIKNIHILNSQFGYELCLKYNKLVRDNCKLYVHIFAFGKTLDNFLVGYAADKVSLIYEYTDKFLSDNSECLKQLVNIFDFSPEKLIELPNLIDQTPMDLTPKKVTKKIFFAGRLSPEKLIELVVKIGSELKNYNIEIDLWGTPSGEYKYMADENYVFPSENIKYRGIFESFFDLPLAEYDLMLFTSLNEGTPNIVLEAIYTSKYIVASAVGGVPVLISHKKNGYLVDDIRNVDEYIEGIKYYYNNFDPASAKAVNNKVYEKHGEKNYLNVLKSVVKPL